MMLKKLLALTFVALAMLASSGALLAATNQPPADGYGPACGMRSRMGDLAGMHRNMMQRMMGNALPLGMDPALLPDPQSVGAQLLQQTCTQCHNLPGPGLHTASEWPQVLARMNMRMQMMRGIMGVVAPTGAELETVLAYLQEHAYQPIDSAKYPDLETKAGRVFSTVCAQCHALPDPRQHGAQEWPAVVARMRHNMTVMGKMVPDDATIREVLDFLQRNSSAKADIRSAQ